MKFNSKKFLQILPLILLCGSNVQALTTSKTLPSKSTSNTLPIKSTSRTLPSKTSIRRIGYPTNVGTVSFARTYCRDPYYNTAKKRDFKSDLLGADSANIQNSLKVKREVNGGWGISGRFDITDSEYKECRDYKTHLEFLDSFHNTKLCFSTCLTGCPEGTTFNKYTGECLNSTEVDEEGWLKNPKCENGVPAKYIEEYDRKCRSIGGKLGFYNNRSLYLSDNCIKNIDKIYCALCGRNDKIYTYSDFLFGNEKNECENEGILKGKDLEEIRERCTSINGKINIDRININSSWMYDCILPMIDSPLGVTRTKTLPNFKSTTTTTSTKALPISKTTTTTTTTTSTKALPISKTTTTTTTTSTKALPISKTTTTTITTTSTKALPISKTTTTTITTTSTKALPISKTTTTTITTTSTKALPISKTTTTTITTTSTKMLPISTTKSTKCIPITVTVTEKETITKKETVTVTVKSNPTSTEDDRKCAAKYEQCGGINFNGPTCCQSGSTCRELNQYYSQCI